MQNQVGFSLKSNYVFLTPNSNPLQNPNPRISPVSNFHHCSSLQCGGIHIPAHRIRLNSLNGSTAAAAKGERIKSGGVKDIDVATLGNLCVDIVLNVPKLPPEAMAERKAYMEELAKSPPDKQFWEAGGNCNVVIAAARLGLRTVTIGHVGDEVYGRFLLDVLDDEGIGMVEMDDPNDVDGAFSAAYETLLCWVFVDPLQRHGFCSRADFSNGPAFCWMQKLSIETKVAIRRSKIILCNGYGFDELSPSLLMSVLDYAVEVGTMVVFDPGPRGKSLVNGTVEEQIALEKYLKMSDVLLLTCEEAESLTGMEDPILAGKELLRTGISTKWVIVKMGSKGSMLITPSRIHCAPAFKVNAIDTVGCGDSFMAAVAFSVIHEMPLICTLTVANAVGAATAMGCGAGRNVGNLKQIMELVRGSNLNEDKRFWEKLLKEYSDGEEITLLTEDVSDGTDNLIKHASFKKAVHELLPKLEHAQVVGTC